MQDSGSKTTCGYPPCPYVLSDYDGPYCCTRCRDLHDGEKRGRRDATTEIVAFLRTWAANMNARAGMEPAMQAAVLIEMASTLTDAAGAIERGEHDDTTARHP